MDIMSTNSILGIKEEIVSPYNDEIKICLRLGFMLSNVILRTIIAMIKTTVKTQNRIFIVTFKKADVKRFVIDCNQ